MSKKTIYFDFVQEAGWSTNYQIFLKILNINFKALNKEKIPNILSLKFEYFPISSCKALLLKKINLV